ncbi:MAG: flavodoxin family protein [Spirochaetia bacterium]|nr:flavodoxin family protein [Spirochaetia bacterium]
MKVTAINGSPRPKGNTAQAIEVVFEELRKEGIETELINIGTTRLSGCIACFKCRENKDKKCVLKGDPMNEYIAKLDASDGIIIGSPVYYGSMTTNTKAVIERCGQVARANNDMFARKIGAPVVAVRRAGSNFTYAAINFFFGILQMPIATSSYWNMTLTGRQGDMQKDEEGVETFRKLGKNMSWLIKKTGV